MLRVHLGLGTGQPPLPHASRARRARRSAPFASAADDVDRRGFVAQSTAAAVSTAALAHASPARADFFGGDEKPQWKQVDLPIATESPILFDIEFDPQNPKNGWIVGNKGTFLQTTDGGATWVARSFSNLDPDEEINYRFTKLSFLNGEGWIIGKPAILLHTTDSGGSWERVPLSPKLPGDPYGIVALGRGKAELSTSAGAIYTTENAGRNWKAEVRETIDATLNRVSSSGVQGASYFSGSINSVRNSAQLGAILRNSAQFSLTPHALHRQVEHSTGSYLAISSRGNFYLTFKPGDEFWVPHNRETSRRITAMGFVKDKLTEGLWMSTAGGELSKAAGPLDTNLINIAFNKQKIQSGGYGILDVAYVGDGTRAWSVGGGGTIFGSNDGGNNWKKDKSADNLRRICTRSGSSARRCILGSNGSSSPRVNPIAAACGHENGVFVPSNIILQ